jgi:hypothetical protein
MLLDHYHGLIIFPSGSADEDECLGCGQNDGTMLRIGLHGGEKYDPELLTIQKTEDQAFGHAMVGFENLLLKKRVFRTSLSVSNASNSSNSTTKIDTHFSTCTNAVKAKYFKKKVQLIFANFSLSTWLSNGRQHPPMLC